MQAGREERSEQSEEWRCEAATSDDADVAHERVIADLKHSEPTSSARMMRVSPSIRSGVHPLRRRRGRVAVGRGHAAVAGEVRHARLAVVQLEVPGVVLVGHELEAGLVVQRVEVGARVMSKARVAAVRDA